MSMETKIIAIDDDPTGSQTVHSCLLLTRWDVATLKQGLQDSAPLFFVLTNTRGMSADQAASVTRDVCVNLRQALEDAKRRSELGSQELQGEVLEKVCMAQGLRAATKCDPLHLPGLQRLDPGLPGGQLVPAHGVPGGTGWPNSRAALSWAIRLACASGSCASHCRVSSTRPARSAQRPGV